jgi:murein tripeptide amidase MpaA
MVQRGLVVGFASALVAMLLLPVVDLSPTSFDSRTKDGNRNPYKVYRLYPNSTQELDACVDIWKAASKYHLNFWKEPSRPGVAVDVMVPSKYNSQFEDLLSERKLDYMITIQDVQKLIEERERRPPSSFEKVMHDESTDPLHYDFNHYYPYEHMRLYMRTIEKKHPEFAKVYTIGFTHEGRPIEMLKIGYPLTKRGKKAVWIDAGIHAREWPSSTTAIYFMQQLASKYGTDPLITQYVQELNWYIVPLLNPDGHEYSRSSTEPDVRMWRKNRAPNTIACGNRNPCCKGVDLNRNFDFHWGETGASTEPCEEVYQGSTPFSEPEARAVRDFINNHKNDIQAVITMHTYSQIWIHPYGHLRSQYPADVSDLRETGEKAANALKKLYGTKYKVGSGADTLYPASGGSDDWTKKAGIKYVYLIELRPEDSVVDGFIMEPMYLLPTGRETWEGVKVVANAVLKRIGIDPADGSAKQSAPFSSRRQRMNT